jgi:hypothetical protein
MLRMFCVGCALLIRFRELSRLQTELRNVDRYSSGRASNAATYMYVTA